MLRAQPHRQVPVPWRRLAEGVACTDTSGHRALLRGGLLGHVLRRREAGFRPRWQQCPESIRKIRPTRSVRPRGASACVTGRCRPCPLGFPVTLSALRTPVRAPLYSGQSGMRRRPARTVSRASTREASSAEMRKKPGKFRHKQESGGGTHPRPTGRRQKSGQMSACHQELGRINLGQTLVSFFATQLQN